MVPRIFPCVPLPEPGAPKSRMVRYFMATDRMRERQPFPLSYRSNDGSPQSSNSSNGHVLMPDADLLDFGVGNAHFGGRAALVAGEHNLGGLHPHDALGGVGAAR